MRSHARRLNPFARGCSISPEAKSRLRQWCAPMRSSRSGCVSWALTAAGPSSARSPGAPVTSSNLPNIGELQPRPIGLPFPPVYQHCREQPPARAALRRASRWCSGRHARTDGHSLRWIRSPEPFMARGALHGPSSIIDAIRAFATGRAMPGMTVVLPALGVALLLCPTIGYPFGLTLAPRGLGTSTDDIPRTAHMTATTRTTAASSSMAPGSTVLVLLLFAAPGDALAGKPSGRRCPNPHPTSAPRRIRSSPATNDRRRQARCGGDRDCNWRH